MSQSDSAVDRAAADERAAEAVVRHHAQLAETLTTHANRLLAAAEGADLPRVTEARDDLVRWLHDDLLPHAKAEETTLYQAAAQRGADLLIDGMLAEHRAIIDLIHEVEGATAPVRSAAAGRALDALFRSHLGKENDLVLPLLVRAEDVSVATLLEGMHELIGGDGEHGHGPGGNGGGHHDH